MLAAARLVNNVVAATVRYRPIASLNLRFQRPSLDTMPAARRSQRLVHTAAAPAEAPVNSAASHPPPPPPRPASSKPTKKKAAKKAATSSSSSASTAAVSSSAEAEAAEDYRCWVSADAAMRCYHDEQWGSPAYFFPTSLDPSTPSYRRSLDRLFQLQCLELMQAGLSWRCIMGKWDSFTSAFDSFHVPTVAQYGAADIDRLLADDGIVRNRLKVVACVENARIIHRMETESPNSFLLLLLAYHVHPPASSPHHSPAHHLIHPHERILPTGRHGASWMRSDFKTPAVQRETSDGVHPSRTVAHLARRLREEGFRFMGDTVVLNWMQAIGLMNHHAAACRDFQRCEVEWQAVHALVQREVGLRPHCSGWMAREEPLKAAKAAAATKKRPRKSAAAKASKEEEEDEEVEADEEEEGKEEVAAKKGRKSKVAEKATAAKPPRRSRKQRASA